MTVAGVTARGWILALFIREDGERFLLGDGMYDFTAEQQHFAANTYENDVVEIQGNDGVLVAGQVRRAGSQTFDGYVGDATTTKADVEVARERFLRFFRKNFLYKVVYIFPDGTAIKRERGFITDAPEVKELYQKQPNYHVALSFEDVNYYRYLEDAEGHEINGQSATVWLFDADSGGLDWDEQGAVFDAAGAKFEAGLSGPVFIDVGSVVRVYPTLTVNGETANFTLKNLTTGQTLTYSGTVAFGQTLTIDMLNQTAKLDGTNVLQNLGGSWLSLVPGRNRLEYYPESIVSPYAKISWPEVVG